MTYGLIIEQEMAWVLKGVKSGRLRTEGIPQRQDDTAYILTAFNTRNTPAQLDIALWNMLSTIKSQALSGVVVIR